MMVPYASKSKTTPSASHSKGANKRSEWRRTSWPHSSRIRQAMKYTYQELAKMTDRELDDGCKLAAKYDVASVCIKPYAVKRAVELLKDTDVLVGCVVGFPHGNSATASKRYETELACKDGADEIDMVINIGKA